MKIDKPFFTIVFVIFLILSLFIVKDYVNLIISCVVIAFLIKPLYNGFFKVFRNKALSAVLSELIFAFLAVSIAVLAINSIYYQFINFGSPIINNFVDINSTFSALNSSSILIDFNDDLSTQIFDIFLQNAKSLVSKTPEFFVSILLLVYIVNYFIIDSDKIYNEFIEIAPQKIRSTLSSLFFRINSLLVELTFGYFLISLFVILISFIFFNFLSIPYPFDYSLLSGLFSLVPVIGIWIVPLFLIAYYIYSGNIIKSILIFIFGIFLWYIIKMIRVIVNKNITIHPILFIIGVIVGFYSFGILGFVIGPVLFGIIQIGVSEIAGKQKNI